jgi:hypothetical protein
MFLRMALFLCASALLAGDAGVHAEVIGGTAAALQGRNKGRMNLADAAALYFDSKAGALRIPYHRIHTLEYGQRASRRYIEGILVSPVLLLSKSRKHYVTIGYADDAGNRQALVFRVGKGDIRVVLAALEAKSGRKVEYTDEEARHSGK